MHNHLQGCHDSSPPDNGLIFDKLHAEWLCLIPVVLSCAPWTWQHYCPYCFFARTTLLVHSCFVALSSYSRTPLILQKAESSCTLVFAWVDHWLLRGLMSVLAFHQYELSSSPQLIDHCTPEPAHQRDQQGVKRPNRWVELGCSMFDANLHTRELIWQACCIITLRMAPSSSWRVLPSAPFTGHNMFSVSACQPSVSTVIRPWQCTNMHRTWSREASISDPRFGTGKILLVSIWSCARVFSNNEGNPSSSVATCPVTQQSATEEPSSAFHNNSMWVSCSAIQVIT
jgi:hypothetical protein